MVYLFVGFRVKEFLFYNRSAKEYRFLFPACLFILHIFRKIEKSVDDQLLEFVLYFIHFKSAITIVAYFKSEEHRTTQIEDL